MEIRITLEWDYETGISLEKMYPFREKLEEIFRTKNYGDSITTMWVLLVCRPYDFKQRKRFKKGLQRFEYDILLDFFLVKHISLEDKKQLIKYQFYQITEKTFEKYKFVNFDKISFLKDLKHAIASLNW